MSPPLSIVDRIKIIEDIEVLDVAQADQVDAKGNNTAVVHGSSFFSFNGNVSGQMKADVLNSTLLAQLAASNKYNRQKQARQWYDYCKYVLEMMGWMFHGFEFVRMSDVNSYLSVDKLLMKLAPSYLTEGELALFKTTIYSLKDAKNKAALDALDKAAKDNNKATFQGGVVSNDHGNAMLKNGIYHYVAQTHIDHVLFFTFGSQTIEFWAGEQTMVLDSNLYDQIREKVLRKLGGQQAFLEINLLSD